MDGYAQLAIYSLSLLFSFYLMWHVDFNKFIRVSRKQFAIFVYIVLSIVVGYLLGRFFIEMSLLFSGFIKK